MSIFSKILNRLGLTKDADKDADQEKAKKKAAAREALKPGRGGTAKPDEISVVDVVSQLEERAAKNPQELNWKVSIVDLLKLLDIDSSLEARRELAKELGCPPDKMDDSAQMNTWLHQTVLQKIAENGGNIPRNLLN